jgi:zinc-ribbon domain
MKICPYCSKKIQDKVTVCPYCGKSLTPTLITRIKSHPKYRLGLVISIVAFLAISFGGVYIAYRAGLFAPKPTCYDQSQAYLNEFMPLFSQWNQVNQQIHGLNKSEIELSEYSMEGISSQISSLTPPQCAKNAHVLFVSYMDGTLNGYNAFLSGEPEPTYKSYLDKAADDYAAYRSAIIKIFPELSIAPTPTP